MANNLREFPSGATRTVEDGKFDYEGFLSPFVLERYAAYMHEHRKLPGDALRDSDNWQLGIAKSAYMKSLWRHFMDVWKIHRGGRAHDPLTGKELTLEDALCAVLFNAMGYLHELLKRD